MLEVPPVKTPKQSPKMSPKKVHPKKDKEQGGSPKLSPQSGSPKLSPKNASPKPSPKKLKAAKDPPGSGAPSPKLPAKKILVNKNINAENIPTLGKDVPVPPTPTAVPNSSPSRLRRSGLGEVCRSSTFDEIKEDAELDLTNEESTKVDGGKAKDRKVADALEEPHLGLLDEIKEETDENDSLPPGSYS